MRRTATRLAVDLPSGLDCDTGEPAEPTIRADHTCTFVATKIGFGNPKAAPYLGQVHVLDIGAYRGRLVGIDRELIEPLRPEQRFRLTGLETNTSIKSHRSNVIGANFERHFSATERPGVRLDRYQKLTADTLAASFG